MFVAFRFAHAGARVGLIARAPKSLNAVKREFEEAGGETAIAAADVADADTIFAAANDLHQALGPPAIRVNDAMVTVFAPFFEMTPDEFRRVAQVRYLGFVHGTMATPRPMRPRDRGTIVLAGSALAYRGIPLQAAYCGAKHAIRAFTNSLRTEFIHDGSVIHVTMVHLPVVNTP